MKTLAQVAKSATSRHFFEGYRDGLRWDAEGAEKEQKKAQMSQAIVAVLEDSYTSGVEALLSYQVEDGTIFGRFRDGARTFAYTLKDNEIEYWLVTGTERVDSLLSEPVWRRDRNPPTAAKKQRKCSVGIKCGNSCINAKKSCKAQPSPQAKQEIATAKKLAPDVLGFEQEFNRAVESDRSKAFEQDLDKAVQEQKASETKKAKKKPEPTESATPQKSGDDQPIPPEKEIRKSGKQLGKGKFGTAYIKDGTVYKYGQVTQNELDVGTKMGEIGVGPKVFGGSAGKGKKGTMAMELLGDHEPLAKKGGDPEIHSNVFTQIEKMHEAGVYHGDIHGGNVMVGPDKSTKMIDFGLSLTKEGQQRMFDAGEGYSPEEAKLRDYLQFAHMVEGKGGLSGGPVSEAMLTDMLKARRSRNQREQFSKLIGKYRGRITKELLK